MAGDCLPLAFLGAYWLLYFIVHSLLASLGAKRAVARRWPALMPAYRLTYNVLAVLLLLPGLVWIYRCPGPVLWSWSGAAWWWVQGIALLAVAGFLVTMKGYDGAEFIGLRQWRDGERRVEDQEQFKLSPLHRFVRHPWYALGIVLVWTREMSAAWFLTAILVTLYFVVGSRMEERKLETYHGEVYREYQRRVPGLIPRPWRWLGKKEARRLVSGTGRRAS